MHPPDAEITLANFVGIRPDGDEALDRWAKGWRDFGKAFGPLPFFARNAAGAGARLHAEDARDLRQDRRRARRADGRRRVAPAASRGPRRAPPRDGLTSRANCSTGFAAGGMWAGSAYGAKALAEDAALASSGCAPQRPRCWPTLRRATWCRRASLSTSCARSSACLVIPMTAIGMRSATSPSPASACPGLVRRLVHAREPRHAGHRAPTRRRSASTPVVTPGRGRRPHHFAPAGSGEALTSHRCGGVDTRRSCSSVAFFTELLRAPTLSLPEQDVTQDDERHPGALAWRMRVRFG